jgi:hypothetical protein
VQNWLVGLATSRLSQALGTEVSIKNVSFSMFNRLNMEGTLVRDKKNDTLLYAGSLKVRITDWFFMKDKAVLKYAGLEDALIRIQRKDSVWNFGFIADYFASPSPSPKKKGGTEFNLKTVDLKNVRFIKNDFWIGEVMDIQLASMVLDADQIDFNKNHFLINTLTLEQPFVRIQSLPALRPDSLRHTSAAVDTGLYFNAGRLLASAAKISIHNGKLFIEGNTRQPYAGFDGSHIELSQLTGTLQQVSFRMDTLKALIDLSVKDRCGLELKKLKTQFRLTPQIMELAKLDLRTNKSHLTNYYAMQFRDFNKDFGEYISNVIMNARFTNAKVHSDDIAYFAPELKDWKKEVILDGSFLGTVEAFSVKNFSARIGNTTRALGTLKMKGLPDINNTRIDFTDGTLQTNYNDLTAFVPDIKGVTEPNLAALGNFIYRGSFNGTINNFVTAGVFSTQLGGVRTNISMKLPRKKEPEYSGSMETTRFNLGKFLNDSSLGLVDFKGTITGSSFSVEKLKTTLEGKISTLEYNGYPYKNIITNGTFQKKYFSGEVKIDDTNLDFTSNIEIDLSKDIPRFNIVGDFVHTDLKALGFSKDSLLLTGLLDVNFSGTNIDNFRGAAKFLNAEVKGPATQIRFDSLALSSYYRDTTKYLTVGSNDFNATIGGTFNILNLPASFQSFLSRYYPTYVKQPKTIPQNQDFRFEVHTGNIEPYLRLVDKKIKGFNDANVYGAVNTRNNQLTLTANAPTGAYDNFSFTGLDLAGKGTQDSLSLTGNINLQVNDSLRFPNTQLKIVSGNDHSVVSINTSADNTLNDASLYADVYTLNDGARIQFRPSSFVLNQKKWNIEKSGDILIRTNLVQAQNVKFTQGFQEISVETPPGSTKASDLVVKMKNVVLGDITSLFFKDPRLEGVTSGEIQLKNITTDFKAEANLKAEQFRMDDDSIGLVNITAGFDSKTGDIPFRVSSPNDGYNFYANGSYNTKDTSGKSFTTDIRLEHSKIDILHKFLGDIFSDIKGQATGNLTIKGDMNAPDLLGNIKLRNAGMKVNYSQVYYTIDSADIAFKEDGIDFGRFTIHDRYRNSGVVSGRLLERGFKNMYFDFDLSSNKLLLIDTKSTDNQQFYGKAIGKVTTFSLKGPETAAKMTIKAEANDSSHIFIPNSVSRESGAADFIVFKQYGTEIQQDKKKSSFNLLVDMDLTADNRVQIDVILDETTNETIQAVGNGKLLIKAGTSEPLTMRGRYNIEHGSYVFNLQGLIHKPFELLPEAGNYIEWNGDPFKADIHIDAQYTAERISLAELVSNLNMSASVQGYRGDVYVITRLTDKLNKPSIKFLLDFPQGSPVKSDNELQQYLARLEKDQNEILNQVAFLILFNSFAPPGGTAANNNGVSPYSLSSLGANTLSQILTKQVNNVMSKLLYKITGDKSIRFDIGTSIYSSSNLINTSAGQATTNNKLDRTRVDLKLGYAFANDKIIVTVGSDIDFNFGASSAVASGSTQFLPNVNIEFVLSKDKKLRLIVFNKTSLDLQGANFGKRQRQGVSISYRKDFETLFGNKERDIEFKGPADSTVANKGSQ